jgi:uncharacterized membrane protein YjdF
MELLSETLAQKLPCIINDLTSYVSLITIYSAIEINDSTVYLADVEMHRVL